MKITILGTGGPEGLPYLFTNHQYNKQRLRPSVLITYNQTSIILDASPDIRQQLLKSKATHLDAVFITHPHFDHFWGIGDLDQLHWKNLDTFSVYLHPENVEYTKKFYPWLSLDLQPMSKPIQIKELTIIPILVEHTKIFPTYGFIIKNKTHKVAYIPDIKSILEHKDLKEIDILIGDGQYILGKYIEDDDHEEGQKLIYELEKCNAKKVYLIGFSEYWYGKSATDAKKELPKNFDIPNDMKTIILK